MCVCVCVCVCVFVCVCGSVCGCVCVGVGVISTGQNSVGNMHKAEDLDNNLEIIIIMSQP